MYKWCAKIISPSLKSSETRKHMSMHLIVIMFSYSNNKKFNSDPNCNLIVDDKHRFSGNNTTKNKSQLASF
jgi:hypothetical protein